MRPTGWLLSPLLLLMWNACCYSVLASPYPAVSATAALVMDADSGELVYEKNSHLPLPMASTTKVMTALLAMERLRPRERVRVSAYAASMEPSKLYLKTGELVDAEDLLQAILLKSANDASVAVAEKISGSEEAFARLMNRRAQELGARHTHFENASGLPSDGHYSTAYDLALIFRYAMQRQDFATVMQMRQARVAANDGRAWNVRSHNKLLWTFAGALGGKTGWTRASRHCYVGMAERGGRTLIVSVLGSWRLWDDVRTLLRYGFLDAGTPDTRLVFHTPSPSTASPSLAAATAIQPLQNHGEVSGGNSSSYTVQVGAFREKRRAELLRRKLRKRGYTAYITTDASPRHRWYRVRVGEFETDGQARRIISRLKHQMGLVGLVATIE